MVMIQDSSSSQLREKRPLNTPPRFVFGKLHIHHTMNVIVAVGVLAILIIMGALYMKFRKAMFVMMVPSTVTVLTVFAIISKRHRFVWPVVAISMFHVILSCYALVIFSFYFFIKPYYILMISNWMFDTMHGEKNAAFYLQSLAMYTFLTCFMLFNAWQAHVGIHYIEHIFSEREESEPQQLHQPTIVTVNKPMY
ncbi:uncharacterized protein CELE_C15C6.1 [Caenorhabditis elegans]|uniref:Uncharacterized protein n=1 Tax=Caenorhabditis elegans TaxID=6239 RepID=Q9XVT5_CAEEL|nr:Uncharacterized protein CELE_C15C6.1 [Caenorhabditis elegans]CAB02726.1 Uncharacterized protein CELE_C15C6.1 [Caenorhabditis elegans]|eukprot:NP_493079.1 Uncharacterized protein CELE_C15C6.1 [Caenorhabditis elegans]